MDSHASGTKGQSVDKWSMCSDMARSCQQWAPLMDPLGTADLLEDRKTNLLGRWALAGRHKTKKGALGRLALVECRKMKKGDLGR